VSEASFTLTAHAEVAMRERGIERSWIERVLRNPEITQIDRVDRTLTHALGRIHERADRVLRVIYNSSQRAVASRDRVLRPRSAELDVKVHFDEKADAVYVRLDESPIVESEEVHPGIILDFDGANHVVGIEILRVSTHVPLANLKQIQFGVA
jgi:uncharacterized protein YuzE